MRVHVILCLSINIYTSIYIYVNNIFSNKQTKNTMTNDYNASTIGQ